MSEVRFTVPLLPPSVNHYKRPKFGGGFYRGPEAVAFEDAVIILSRRETAHGATYEVEVTFYLAPAKFSRLKTNDGDNYLKVAIDSLAAAGIITNDGAVLDLHVHKRQAADKQSERTEYWIIGKD